MFWSPVPSRVFVPYPQRRLPTLLLGPGPRRSYCFGFCLFIMTIQNGFNVFSMCGNGCNFQKMGDGVGDHLEKGRDWGCEAMELSSSHTTEHREELTGARVKHTSLLHAHSLLSDSQCFWDSVATPRTKHISFRLSSCLCLPLLSCDHHLKP